MQKMFLVAIACLIGSSVDAQATAQGRPRTADDARRVERDTRRVEREASVLGERVLERVMMDDSAAMNRATLGLMLGGGASKRDTLGVFVEGVAEDGPAERAGIYEGHRIAFINNVDVRATAADAGDPYLSNVGRHRLMRAMRDVRAGSTVTLRVWTGSGYRDVQVAAARYADVYKNRRFGAMTFGGPDGMLAPSMQHFRMQAPTVRLREVRPGEVRALRRRVPSETAVPRTRGTPRTRVTPAPAPAPPRGPRALIATPMTPEVTYAPRIAPTVTLRRYSI